MQKATHINVGLTTVLALIINTLSFNIFFLYYVIISLIQDADHAQSSIVKKIGIKLPFKHRGFTHTLIFIIILQLIINAFVYFLNVKFGIGHMLTEKENIVLFILLHAHLFADMFTVSGIPYLYPFYKGNIKIPGISVFTTGKSGEYFFNLIISIVNISMLVYIYSKIGFENISGIKETQELVKTTPGIMIGTIIAFIFLGIHLISAELKSLGKNTKRMFKNLGKMLKNIIITILFLVSVGFSILYINPTINPLYIIIAILVLIFISVFIQFNKQLELASKTIGYLINTFSLTLIFGITFNLVNI